VANRQRADAIHAAGNASKGCLLLACVLLAFSRSVAAAEIGASPCTHVIIIEGMRFTPPTLTVHRGDRVTWFNKDLFPHTASASSGAFDLQSIAPNSSWTYTVRKPGSYP
jgi:plastocyanin